MTVLVFFCLTEWWQSVPWLCLVMHHLCVSIAQFDCLFVLHCYCPSSILVTLCCCCCCCFCLFVCSRASSDSRNLFRQHGSSQFVDFGGRAWITAVSVLSAGSKVSQCERMFLSSSISSLAKLSAYLTGKAAKATAVSLVLYLASTR